MKTFGQQVREIREQKGIMLQELASEVGKSDAYLSQIENPRSGTPPSEEAGELIIQALGVDSATQEKLKKALERTIREHKVERMYDSSLLLELFFKDTHLSVEQVAKRMTGKTGERRSRQIVQVWKNGLQLPTPKAVDVLISVFGEAGVSDDLLKEYRRKHVFDTVYFSKDIAHFSEKQKVTLAECAIKILDGHHDQEHGIEMGESIHLQPNKRRFKGEMLS